MKNFVDSIGWKKITPQIYKIISYEVYFIFQCATILFFLLDIKEEIWNVPDPMTGLDDADLFDKDMCGFCHRFTDCDAVEYLHYD